MVHRAATAAVALLTALRMGGASALGYACNILSDPSSSCMLPYPDDFFLSKSWDASAPLYLTLQNSTLPIDDTGKVIDPDAGGFNALEGFSPMGPIIAYFPSVSLSLSGLPRLWNISKLSTNNIVLLNVATGATVPVWTETDNSGGNSSTPYERALLIWPGRRLEDGAQYIVALRNIIDENGIPVAPSSGFLALRDKIPTQDPALEASRARYEVIFNNIASTLAWSRSSLSLAWTFTTNTRTDITQRILHMRDDAFARVAAGGGVTYAITSIEEKPSNGISRRVIGQFMVPCYLNDNAVPSLTSRLQLDAVSGLPVFQKFVNFTFELSIPESVANGSKPAGPVNLYGHGLFGDASEIEMSVFQQLANDNGWIYLGVDWIGLSQWDAATVVVMMANSLTDFRIVPDRLHQGVLNFLVVLKMFTPGSAILSDPALIFPAAPTGVISLNASQRFYTGNSQGGIMGGVYMALTTDVLFGVLGEAGAPYSLLLPRSVDFSDLFTLLKSRYPRSIDRMLAMVLLQSLWDRIEGSGYVGYITAPGGAAGGPGVLPNTPSHRVIWHYGLGDAQVTWLGAHAIALTAGAVMYSSQRREGNESLSEFTLVSDDTIVRSGNVIQGFDFGFPQVPFDNTPPTNGYDAHDCVGKVPSAQRQMAHFFTTGDIVNMCGGPCVQPAPGGGHSC